MLPPSAAGAIESVPLRDVGDYVNISRNAIASGYHALTACYRIAANGFETQYLLYELLHSYFGGWRETRTMSAVLGRSFFSAYSIVFSACSRFFIAFSIFFSARGSKSRGLAPRFVRFLATEMQSDHRTAGLYALPCERGFVPAEASADFDQRVVAGSIQVNSIPPGPAVK